MHDRTGFWRPAAEPGAFRFEAVGVTIHVVEGLSQTFVSGRILTSDGILAGVQAPVGFAGVASGPVYAAALARDRILLVCEGEPPLAEGWSAETGLAVTRVDDGYVVLDIAGPDLDELLAKATTLSLQDPTPSASIVFASLPCIGYRHGTSSTLRLHVERPSGAALATWLASA